MTTDQSGLRTPAEWERQTGYLILDPDGWWYSPWGPKAWDEPLSYEDFMARLGISTVRPRST